MIAQIADHTGKDNMDDGLARSLGGAEIALPWLQIGKYTTSNTYSR